MRYLYEYSDVFRAAKYAGSSKVIFGVMNEVSRHARMYIEGALFGARI